MICTRCLSKFSDDKARCPKCGKFFLDKPRENAKSMVKRLSEADDIALERLYSGPWDLCFGPANGREKNGVARTSVTLIGGKNGAGKSTLALQICDEVCGGGKTKGDVLYICSEEDTDEVKYRAKRLGCKNLYNICGVSTLTSSEALSSLESIISDLKPRATVLDSLPGLTGKDQDAAVELCKLLKVYSVRYKQPSIIIDHITKSDDFAGKEELQHVVDATMTLFPTDENPDIRMLETLKNRFGRAFVSVYLEMTETGLVYVESPKEEEEENNDKE
jgi:DNA repair protein RadA/Sms